MNEKISLIIRGSKKSISEVINIYPLQLITK